jgi:hypothetical protein
MSGGQVMGCLTWKGKHMVRRSLAVTCTIVAAIAFALLNTAPPFKVLNRVPVNTPLTVRLVRAE